MTSGIKYKTQLDLELSGECLFLTHAVPLQGTVDFNTIGNCYVALVSNWPIPMITHSLPLLRYFRKFSSSTLKQMYFLENQAWEGAKGVVCSPFPKTGRAIPGRFLPDL